MSDKDKKSLDNFSKTMGKYPFVGKNKKKSKSLDSFSSTMGIYPFVGKNKKKAAKSEMEKDIEIYQNDRTKGLPQEAYEQEDQSISYEAPKMNMGGECRGSKAIRGKKFTGVF